MMTSTRATALAAALLGLFLAAGPLAAQDFEDAPPPPDMPDEAAPPPVLDERARQLQELEEADVIIMERDGETRREYRVDGDLVIVEVNPAAGPTYYLVDVTGEGDLRRRDDLSPDFTPPRWRILEW
ncbi:MULTISPECIES: DUF2782 domain-containing protein [Thioalkalivibrio]|uniref:DUF2782 domain-containing protein n=1 Tax=Thioalkalivibrio halophilus TaxID=252474 RepID=A0A1V2ZXF0_9GAMM|nr:MULTISPECIES: DUF2782 domain-containing protein [Thioalkalivibrio]OOC09804.1 hypothetical protein B1A74_09280 [Thioalkalivibrio halophilus]PYG03598.1 uncharacterized protein DUF2782 [Thioalkalivibrio sp. ALE21]